MSMELIDFAFGTLTGVAGNTVYESLKLILGGSFDKLESLAKADDKATFELLLQTAIEQNQTLKQQLAQLQQGQPINIVTQHNIHGDNIAGNKIVRS